MTYEGKLIEGLKPRSSIEFKSVGLTELSAQQAIDAHIAKPQDFIGVGLSKQGFGGCTSTLIGPNTLITAAHCVDDDGSPAKAIPLSMRLRTTTARHNFDCTIHPDYAKSTPQNGSPRSSHDVALCLLKSDETINLGALKAYEVLEPSYIPAVNDPILITGFGCTQAEVSEFTDSATGNKVSAVAMGGVSDGFYRIGEEKIDDLVDLFGTLGPNGEFIPNPNYVAIFVSEGQLGDGNPKLCPVDSGGPLFKNATVSNHTGNRRVVGINSSIAWSDTFASFSNFTDLSDPSIKKFITDFIGTKGARICGVNIAAGTNGCRD